MSQAQNEHTFDDFLEVHECQLLASGVPEIFWECLFEKLKNETLDAGNTFQVIFEESEDGKGSWSVHATRDVNARDRDNIYLIDHAWTFRPNTARTALKKIEGLKERVVGMLEINEDTAEEENGENGDPGSYSAEYVHSSGDEGDVGSAGSQQVSTSSSSYESIKQVHATRLRDGLVERILERLWCYAQTYTVRLCDKSVMDENDVPLWYLPDEFGLRIGNSMRPNVRMVPFLYAFDKMAYSILFPIADIGDQDEVTRNFIDTGLYRDHPNWQDTLLYPWTPRTDVSNLIAAGFHYFPKATDYYTSGRIPDQLPEQGHPPKHAGSYKEGDVVKVYADDFQLIDRLQRIKVQKVDDPLQADIVWMRNHFHAFKQFAEENPNGLVNQFPYESVLTVKDLVAASVQAFCSDQCGLDPEKIAEKLRWYSTTFNLNYELPAFVAYFLHRETQGADNTWIIKPYNLARSLDMHVTRNLNCIIRMAESGPKVACKYIHNPVLFVREDSGNRVKFDLRYIVLLKSMKEPLEVYLYNDFWVRFSVNEYDLNDLDDSFTHMSVHNYSDRSKVLDMKCEDFVRELEIMYPGRIKWDDVQARINEMVKEVFKVVSTFDPPRGVAGNIQSRAMYGFDVMLKWTDDLQTSVEPCFLEANFMPDCERACNWYDEFPDTVFETLFLGIESDKVTKL